MEFRVLPEALQPLAAAARGHFGAEFGIPLARFRIEEEVAQNIPYRPTFQATKPDHSIIGIEISDKPIPPEIQALILGCKNQVIPLKLWVVCPLGSIDNVKPSDLHFAKENGIGIIELDLGGHSRVLAGPPLALSLTGVRPIRYSDFPSRYREDLRSAHDTFVGGAPAKGCAIVYDELEGLTRRILKRAVSKNFVRKACGFDPDTESWANVLNFLKSNFDRAASACPGLSDGLFNRILGITEYRNESGHKAKSLKKLIERDKQLRTRFESAIDELSGLIDSSRPLRP